MSEEQSALNLIRETRRLIGVLREAIRSIRALAAEHLGFPVGPDEELTLDHRSIVFCLAANFEAVAALVRDLDRFLEENGFEGEGAPLDDGGVWSLGTCDLRFNHRAIYKGFLEPIFRKPIVDELPDRVLKALISIGEDDILWRERGGGVGWHYHYMNAARQRSDVLLAWDTRAKIGHGSRGIFSERHAERGKEFIARPDLWRNRKRESIHTACRHDLDKWALSDFRNASNKADVVWPLNATLTPHLPAVSSGSIKTKSKGHQKQRR